VRDVLPDATYTTWDPMAESLPRALAEPPLEPVVPNSALAAYSSTPLPKKLGINEGSVVALVDAPPGVRGDARRASGRSSGTPGNRGRRDLTIVFVRSSAEASGAGSDSRGTR